MNPKTFLLSRVLSGFPEIKHGFTTKSGDLDPNTFPFLGEKIAVLNQVHGADIAVIGKKESHDLLGMPIAHGGSRLLGSYDAVITDQRGITISVKTADCTPILVFDAKHKVIAAIHAGWRSAAAGILPKTLA
ncbi:MAG: laccase domain-containing protein, partial [Spirochaetia bacterium]|nr:laccase domain-containing protein [Spirochaetia bacterium]